MKIELAKLELERANLMTELRAQVLNEGMKGLFLMNGGGAVALATWLQAVWGKEWAAPMIPWHICGMAAFAFGVFVAAFVPLARYLGSLHKNSTKPKDNPWWWTHLIATVLSIFCFAGASGLIVYGGLEALKTPTPTAPNKCVELTPGPTGAGLSEADAQR